MFFGGERETPMALAPRNLICEVSLQACFDEA